MALLEIKMEALTGIFKDVKRLQGRHQYFFQSTFNGSIQPSPASTSPPIKHI